MSKECKWLHKALEELPLVKYKFNVEQLPHNGIYFFYEKGEHGHGTDRIVRIGTHKNGNFRSRIAEHYLINNRGMNFDECKPKPSDRSIFRKNIGRALLKREKDPYLETWEIDFMTKESVKKYGYRRNLQIEHKTETMITDYIRNNLFFRFIIIDDENERMGNKGLESNLIGTVARCKECGPSENWLGSHSPKEHIRNSGLWLSQHLKADILSLRDMEKINDCIQDTIKWIKNQ